ncbi:MAG: MFS transporter, partial [Solirubrobacteraceae bacterium]
MRAITASPGALRLFVLSLVARLPLSMFTVALLLHAQHLTGSLAVGGAVTGAYAISLGIGGPLLGRRVDRHGQTTVLLVGALITGGLLTALALLPRGAPAGLIIALAAGAGLASPPIDACMRTLFGALLPDEESVRVAY